MAGARIVIDSNAAEIGALLDRLAAKLGPEELRWVYGQFGKYLDRSLDKRFAEQVDPEGRPWAPLSEVTKERKPKNKDRILQMEGHLRDSFLYQIAADADGVEFGTNDVRAATHQFGAKMGEFGRYYQLSRLGYGTDDFRRYAGMHQGHPIPWGDIPARAMLGISAEDREALLGIVEDYLAL
jgi:phage virion morphogenesis protein